MNTDKDTISNKSDCFQKKHILLIIIPSFLFFLSGLLSVLFASFMMGRAQLTTADTVSVTVAKSTDSIKEEESLPAALISSSEYYVIKEDADGYVSVYLSDGRLYRRLDILAYVLPAADRERLRIGIMVKSDLELDSYVEGFSG